MKLNDLPEDILEEIYKHVYFDSLERITQMNKCVSCDTCIQSHFSPCLQTICDCCFGRVCSDCSLRMRNFGRGFQLMNGKCYKCRKMVHGVDNVVQFKRINHAFAVLHS